MYRQLKLFAIFSFAALPLFFVVGCSKKEEKKSEAVLQSNILKKLPASTYGFLTWDTTTDAYKKFQSSFASASSKAWFDDLLSELAEMEKTSQQSQKVTPILRWLSNEGFIQLSPGQNNSIARGLLFFEIKQDAPLPALGLYTEGQQGINLSQKLTSFQELLKSEGVSAQGYSSNGVSGFSVALKEPTPGDNTAVSVYFAADAKRFVAASSEPLLQHLFQEGDGAGINAIQGSEQYKKVIAELPDRGNELSFAYLDVHGLLQRIKPLLPLQPGQEKDFDRIPIDSAAASSQMQDSFVSNVGILLNDSLNSFGNMKAALASTRSWTPLSNHPKNTVLAISLSNTVLKTIQEIALSQESDPQKRSMMASQLKDLENIKSLNLSVLQGDAASFLPGLVVSAYTPEQQELYAMLHGTLGALASGGGMPTSGWQKTNLEGAEVDYMLSPMGVGAYLAKQGDSLLLTTSQSSMVAALKANQGKGETLQRSLPKQSTQPLSDTTPIVAGYLDAESLASLVQRMQGSLAMFTGGQNPVDAQQLDQIR
ncbi:MAG: hypothetical protein KDD55_03590, partial [Bdellovibrionales bacterium]|nr:hypothetical protein [Bdellovibrionales bacterium]